MKAKLFLEIGFIIYLIIFFDLYSISKENKFLKSESIWVSGVKGIYNLKLNTDTGNMKKPLLQKGTSNSNFHILNKNKTLLYSACYINNKPSISVFKIVNNEYLEFINSQEITFGAGSHICLDRDEKLLFSAQFRGSIEVFPLNPDGSINKSSMHIKYEKDPKYLDVKSNPWAKTGPRIHSVDVSIDNKFLFLADMSYDRILIYKIDHENSLIKDHRIKEISKGEGPRHMKWSKDGSILYVLNELKLSIYVFRYDSKLGDLNLIQKIQTLSNDIKSKELHNYASEIRVHPSGNFVYTANRGHDSISVFLVNKESGKLKFVEYEPIRGVWPRNFNLNTKGTWLVCGGTKSNTISSFKINKVTGELTFSNYVVNCLLPMCLGD